MAKIQYVSRASYESHETKPIRTLPNPPNRPRVFNFNQLGDFEFDRAHLPSI